MKVNPSLSKVILLTSLYGCVMPVLCITGLFIIMDIVQVFFVVLYKVDYNFKETLGLIIDGIRNHFIELLMIRLGSGYGFSLFISFYIFRNITRGLAYRYNIIVMCIYLLYCLLYYFLFKNQKRFLLTEFPVFKEFFVGMSMVFGLYIILAPLSKHFIKPFKNHLVKFVYYWNNDSLLIMFVTRLIILEISLLFIWFVFSVIVTLIPSGKNIPYGITIYQSLVMLFNEDFKEAILFVPLLFTVMWLFSYKKIRQMKRNQNNIIRND